MRDTEKYPYGITELYLKDEVYQSCEQEVKDFIEWKKMVKSSPVNLNRDVERNII